MNDTFIQHLVQAKVFSARKGDYGKIYMPPSFLLQWIGTKV